MLQPRGGPYLDPPLCGSAPLREMFASRKAAEPQRLTPPPNEVER